MSDAPRFPASHFDTATGRELDPAAGQEAGLHAFAALPDLAPLWQREAVEARPVPLVRDGTGLALESLGLRLSLSPGPEGWLRLDVTGSLSLTAWVERPYEDWELYPDAAPARMTDPPGRLRPALDRLELDTSAWPVLSPMGNAAGWLILTAAESWLTES